MTIRHQSQRRAPKCDAHEVRLMGLGVTVITFRDPGGRWFVHLSRVKGGNVQMARQGWWKSRKGAISGAARYARSEAGR